MIVTTWKTVETELKEKGKKKAWSAFFWLKTGPGSYEHDKNLSVQYKEFTVHLLKKFCSPASVC